MFRKHRFLWAIAIVSIIGLAALPAHAQLVGNGDGLMNVNYINTQVQNPGNNTANWLALWDNLDAGGTGPGTFFRWDLKPGTYTFASSTGESSAVVQLEVKAGQLYFIRQDARMGIESGRVTIKEVDEKQGKSEVGSCKLLVSAYVPD